MLKCFQYWKCPQNKWMPLMPKSGQNLMKNTVMKEKIGKTKMNNDRIDCPLSLPCNWGLTIKPQSN